MIVAHVRVRKGHQIDLVLSDMVMPVMGGMELFTELHKKNPAVRFAIATGYPLSDNGKSMIERGIVGWIQKPFSMDQLAEIVRTGLDSRPQGRGIATLSPSTTPS